MSAAGFELRNMLATASVAELRDALADADQTLADVQQAAAARAQQLVDGDQRMQTLAATARVLLAARAAIKAELASRHAPAATAGTDTVH